MKPRWCRLFGCTSLFARWFYWPHDLCAGVIRRAEMALTDEQFTDLTERARAFVDTRGPEADEILRRMVEADAKWRKDVEDAHRNLAAIPKRGVQ